MKISILGQATTKIGEWWTRDLIDLIAEASTQAISVAEIEAAQIEAIFVASKASGEFNQQLHLNALVSELFTHQPPAVRVEAACASGGVALTLAEQALQAGRYQTVLVVGAEKMTDLAADQTTAVLAMAADGSREYGATFPGLYALLAQQYLLATKKNRDQLSAVAVKNHRQALSNPVAQFHQPITIEQVNQSALIADPLRLLDCSPISDGASAVVLTTRRVKNKPQLLAYGQAQDWVDLAHRASLTSLAATVKAAHQVYAAAGIKPSQIQMAEVHDCFTIAELLAIEDLGFFPKLKGGEATLAGKTTLGQKIVINPSGGLKAGGHPVGATGVKQVAFLAELINQQQLSLGLAHNIGGSGATAVIHLIAASNYDANHSTLRRKSG